MHPKTKHIIFLSFILFSITSFAQTPLWQWIKINGSYGNIYTNHYLESARQLGTDAFGNIYGISSISSNNRFIDTVHEQNGQGYDDFCVFSYRCDGSFRWVRFFGSSNNDLPGGLTVTPEGDVFVSGGVIVGPYSNAIFGDTIIYQNSTYVKYSFIAKLDSTGQTQWLSLPGPDMNLTSNRFIHMEMDNQGNPVVLAWFYTSTQWNGFTIPTPGHYLITFDPNSGSMLGVTDLEFKQPNPYPILNHFTLDTDNSVYVSCSVSDTIILGNDTVLAPIVSGAQSSILAKFDSAGHKIWHQEVGGVWESAANPPQFPNYQIITGKPVVCNNNVYIAGETQSFPGSQFLGISVSNPIAKSGSHRTKIFSRFNKNTGAFIGANNFWHNDVISDPIILIHQDSIYITGGGGILIILNNTDTLKPFTNDWRNHPFIIQTDTAISQFQWGVGTEALSNYTKLQMFSAVVDNNGNIILGGSITGPVINSFGDTSQIIGGNTDFFIAKIATTNTNCGCKPADPQPQMVSLFEKVLTMQGATTIGADSLAWLWGDGTSTPYPQPGTAISHTYAQGGSYTVCLRAWNICGVSDSCFQVLNVGVNDLVIQNPELVIYPNPFKDALNIELPENMSDAQTTLYDLVGKLVLNLNLPGNNTQKTITLDTGTLEPGIYIIHLVSKNGGRFVGRVVRK